MSVILDELKQRAGGDFRSTPPDGSSRLIDALCDGSGKPRFQVFYLRRAEVSIGDMSDTWSLSHYHPARAHAEVKDDRGRSTNVDL